MKKILASILFFMVSASFFAGCSDNQARVTMTYPELPENYSIVPETYVTTETTTPTTTFPTLESVNLSSNGVDLDLTLLSSTMVYAEVYGMMYEPDSYIGKTVRINGTFVTFSNQDQTIIYPAVLIADATACCSQGMEFVLEGEPEYPDGYPEIGTNITIVGTFVTYEEDGMMFCHLIDSRFE